MIVITGFGPFGSVEDNPSAWLAERSGRPHRVMEVAFEAVEETLRDLESVSFEALLLLGVALGSPVLRIETVARNRIGSMPDVRGVVGGPGPIDPFGPPQLGATLWRDPIFYVENGRWAPSVDAGDYLCNYAFYRARQRFPDRGVGFLHVPSADDMALSLQLETLQEILAILDQGSAAVGAAVGSRGSDGAGPFR